MKTKACFVLFIVAVMVISINCGEGKKSGFVDINGIKIPYTVEGQGVPCIIVCDAIIQQQALSENLREYIKFIFIETRISIENDSLMNYETISIDTILDDINKIRDELKFNKVGVLGHSICGLIALEYARKYPENTLYVIMINTPPYFNQDYMQIINKYWEENATVERKEIFKENMEILSKESDSLRTKSQQSIAWYVKAAPKYWYNPKYDCSWLFDDYYENVDGWNYFFNSVILGYDIKDKEEIDIPVFITQAKYDFVAPHTFWDDRKEKLPNISYNYFEESGHYPQIEEQELFDTLLIEWIKSL